MADTTAVAIYKLGLETQDYVRSAQAAKQANEGLVASAEKLVVTEEKVNRATRTSGDELQRLEARYDQRIKLEQRLQAEQARMARLAQAGIGTEADRARVYSLVETSIRRQIDALNIQDAAIRKSATATGLARHELINLSRQFQDIGVSLAGGQSPFRILIEQGSQIADVIATSKAAFGDLWRSMIAGIARFAGSATGVVVGLTAIGAAGAVAAMSWREGQREIERSLIGIGEASGLSVDKVNKIAEAASSTTRLSTSGAREAAMEFIKTGKIYEENVGRAIQLTDKFALAIGKDTTTAAKELADILSDTGKGADTLGKLFGVLDGKTREYLLSLVRANREQEAQRLLLDKYGPTITKAAEATGVWTRAWMAFTKAISDAYDMMGKTIARGQEFQAPPPTAGDRSRQGSPGRVMAQGMRAADDEALAFGQNQQALTSAAKAAEAALAAENKRLDEFSRQADDAVTSIIPTIRSIQQLEQGLEDLRRAQDDARISGRMGFAEQLQPAIDATKLQIQLQKESQAETARHVTAVTELAAKYNQVSVQVAMMLESLKDQAAVARAAPGPEKTAAEDQARFNQLLLEGKSIVEATALVEAERGVKQAQFGAQLEQQIHQSRQQSELTLASINGEGDRVKVAQEYINVLRQTGDQELANQAAQEKSRALAEQRVAEEILATREYNLQLQAITARSRAERTSLAGLQAYNAALAQGKEGWQAEAAAVRAVRIEEEKIAQVHKDNMAALNDQLMVAKALPGSAQQMAQMEADVNARLREGATLMEAQTEAATKRQIATENANRAVDQQIISLRQAVELERARMEGNEGAVAAAHAYANAIRAGASETKAAALAAATLQANLERAQIAAENMANTMSQAQFDLRVQQQAGTAGSPIAGATGGSMMVFPGPGGMPSHTAVPIDWRMAGALEYIQKQQEDIAESNARIAAMQEETARAARATQPGSEEYIQAQQEAARAQQQAAQASLQAAEAQVEAAKAAREAYIQQLDVGAPEDIARALLGGQTPQQINALIEAGQIQFGTASARFEAQLDLYKRAGMSSAQTAADIRAGLIGEGAKPTELLAALDSLTEAVTANTDAQMIGLSPFYTQQGDRLVGYRGFSVQTDPFRQTGGTGTGTGTTAPPIMGGGMGSVINAPGVPGDPVYSTAPIIYSRLINGQVVTGYYNSTGQWVAISSGTSSGGTMSWGGTRSPTSYSGVTWHAEGGIVDRPTLSMFGEAGPEAFVPLKGGAIPVKLLPSQAANMNERAKTEININAPLVMFAAEPTRDEVRESGFQTAQILRRVMAGG
jgi:phage-related minor tail protein